MGASRSTRLPPRSPRLLVLILACTPVSCIADSVLDEHARASAPEEQPILPWVPASPPDLLGGWESDGIEGEVAGLVWKIDYYFSDDGSYTGAALVLADPDPQFQTLTGTWSLDSGALTLNSDAPVPAWIASDRMKLDGPTGTVTFRRVRFQ